MRICNGCGKEIPLGMNCIQLRIQGMEDVKKLGCSEADFCRAECIELWLSTRLKLEASAADEACLRLNH